MQRDAGLVRGIRKWDLVAFFINSVIGGGIFGLPSQAYALTGVYSIVAYLVCALLAALIVACFAELGSRFSATGGRTSSRVRLSGGSSASRSDGSCGSRGSRPARHSVIS